MRTTCARSVERRMVRTVPRDKPALELRCYEATHLANDRDRIEPVVVNSGTTAQAF
jgi:hypothetical protein